MRRWRGKGFGHGGCIGSARADESSWWETGGRKSTREEWNAVLGLVEGRLKVESLLYNLLLLHGEKHGGESSRNANCVHREVKELCTVCKH